MKYRPEIDGLRAIAVIPVILFHAKIELFGGGFVGVDIFFVISGYLITMILIEEIEKKKFSLKTFYERRARRILPALFLVIIVCIPIAWLMMLPTQLVDFAESLIAVLIFLSNFYFMQHGGYFGAAVEEMPFLHSWSLAVEEQFYLFFPILLFFFWKIIGKRGVFFLVVLLAIISLFLAEIASRYTGGITNFFFTITRAWELLAGSICAFIICKNGLRSNNFLSIIGFFLICFSIIVYDHRTPFPSLYTLAPILGVVLVILYADKSTYLYNFLSTKLLVYLGLISYSAYLWHQPLFAFTRLRFTEDPSVDIMIFLSLFSFVLAWLSWRFLEKPFRNKKIVSMKLLLVFCSFCTLILLSGSFFILNLKGKLNSKISIPPNLTWLDFGERVRVEGLPCNRNVPISNDYSMNGCIFGDLNSFNSIVLVGDSHSAHLTFVLERYAKATKKKIYWLNLGKYGTCEQIPDITINMKKPLDDCEGQFNDLLRYISELKAPIIVSNRWTFKMYPIHGENISMPYTNSDGFTEKYEKYREHDVLLNGEFHRSPEMKARSLERYIGRLAQVSPITFLVYPVPETAIPVSKANINSWLFEKKILNSLSIPEEDYDERNSFILKVFDALSTKNIIKIKTKDLFCSVDIPNRCVVQIDQKPLYVDDDHLSDYGAMRILNRITPYLDIYPNL